MFILKAVFIISAVGAFPVALRLGPVSLGGLATGLIFLSSVINVLNKPVLPRSAVPLVVPLALFAGLNLAWTLLTLRTTEVLRNDVVVWGGMLFLTVIAANNFAASRTSLTILEKTIRRSSYVYVAVLLWLVAIPTGDVATSQVGIIFFSYYLAALYQGDRRSMYFLIVIIAEQIILGARMVVGAELILLIFGRLLTREMWPSASARLRWYVVIGVVISIGLLAILFSNVFEAKMFVGDAALNIGGVTINTSGRMYWWKIAMESALEAPIVGHGTPGPAEMLSTVGWGHPHNDYIRIFHQSGLIGCLLWLAYVGKSMFASWRGARSRSVSDGERRWCHATCMTVLGVSIVMITDNTIVYSYVVYPFAVMIGVAVVIQGKQLSRNTKLMFAGKQQQTLVGEGTAKMLNRKEMN